MGPCSIESEIEWVKKEDDLTMKNIKYYNPKKLEKKEKDDLIRLKWQDYSWEYPGWNDQTIHGF